ncbi:hypothetical protein CV102_04080 [Natronococcus pandeyae]|uniref:Uncharacterized protein n=1 Tax=Natronococcus pandeyae TaxID=2055836 RepID=A0A8J8Q5L5_9EURY|nr:hypothetical protein [Natronococcus pandeyae]TYL39482.1 hypothetical protein CV102_04080 [Natronococcus pandeyae]
MNLEVYDGKQRVGELDIQRTNGEIVESKSSFGYDPDVVDREFENKLTTMREHGDVDLDGNTLEVRATHIGDQNIVESSIQKWESELVGSGEWNNADVTVKVVDESTDTVIEG